VTTPRRWQTACHAVCQAENGNASNVILRSLLAKSLSAKFWNEALEVTMIRLIHKVMGQDVGNA